VQVFP